MPNTCVRGLTEFIITSIHSILRSSYQYRTMHHSTVPEPNWYGAGLELICQWYVPSTVPAANHCVLVRSQDGPSSEPFIVPGRPSSEPYQEASYQERTVPALWYGTISVPTSGTVSSQNVPASGTISYHKIPESYHKIPGSYQVWYGSFLVSYQSIAPALVRWCSVRYQYDTSSVPHFWYRTIFIVLLTISLQFAVTWSTKNESPSKKKVAETQESRPPPKTEETQNDDRPNKQKIQKLHTAQQKTRHETRGKPP